MISGRDNKDVFPPYLKKTIEAYSPLRNHRSTYPKFMPTKIQYALIIGYFNTLILCIFPTYH